MYNFLGDCMKTIKENTISKYEINKSIFICCLYKINSIDEVKTYLEEAKNNFKDATHYTYAYIIDEARKSSDDGEPGGTAGVPIMEVLLKHELNYVLCIVIRYFGGIKLGTGGLVRACRKSACIGIDNSTVLNLVDGYKIEITASYEEQKNIEKLIKNYTFSKTYTDIVKYELNIKQDDINILNCKNVNYKILKTLKIEL